MPALSKIPIDLSDVKKGLILEILEKQDRTLFDEEKESLENNEARYQIYEGCFYDFELSDSEYSIKPIQGNLIQAHRKHPNIGTLAPNIFVGTLYLELLKKGFNGTVKKIPLEVRSKKTGYRDDYRDMLEYITEKCTDLLLQINSPVFQNFEPNF